VIADLHIAELKCGIEQCLNAPFTIAAMRQRAMTQ
jgi:hypothetical protein